MYLFFTGLESDTQGASYAVYAGSLDEALERIKGHQVGLPADSWWLKQADNDPVHLGTNTLHLI